MSKLEQLRELCDTLRIDMSPIFNVVEAGRKLADYVEECYPGLYVTDTIREALEDLEK